MSKEEEILPAGRQGRQEVAGAFGRKGGDLFDNGERGGTLYDTITVFCSF